MMAASQLDLIMNRVLQLSANEQLQLIKRVADLLERAGQSSRSEEQLAAMAADPNIQRELRQVEAESPAPSSDAGDIGMVNGEAQKPEASTPGSRASARAASLRDFTADHQWLADHRDEYAGQWVALKFGRLISHGKSAKEVHRAAQDAGHQDALLVLVEPSDAPPFIL
ncbi:MAG: DUF5678 domain-containing protein [Blastocatellia bacterium]